MVSDEQLFYALQQLPKPRDHKGDYFTISIPAHLPVIDSESYSSRWVSRIPDPVTLEFKKRICFDGTTRWHLCLAKWDD